MTHSSTSWSCDCPKNNCAKIPMRTTSSASRSDSFVPARTSLYLTANDPGAKRKQQWREERLAAGLLTASISAWRISSASNPAAGGWLPGSRLAQAAPRPDLPCDCTLDTVRSSGETAASCKHPWIFGDIDGFQHRSYFAPTRPQTTRRPAAFVSARVRSLDAHRRRALRLPGRARQAGSQGR